MVRIRETASTPSESSTNPRWPPPEMPRVANHCTSSPSVNKCAPAVPVSVVPGRASTSSSSPTPRDCTDGRKLHSMAIGGTGGPASATCSSMEALSDRPLLHSSPALETAHESMLLSSKSLVGDTRGGFCGDGGSCALAKLLKLARTISHESTLVLAISPLLSEK